MLSGRIGIDPLAEKPVGVPEIGRLPGAGTRRSEPGSATMRSASAFHSADEAPHASRKVARRTLTSDLVGGSSCAAVRIWANGFRLLLAPTRPSSQYCSGVARRPLIGVRTTSPSLV